jgi:hypothetical protein
MAVDGEERLAVEQVRADFVITGLRASSAPT